MAAELQWDKTGEHYYETGVDRGVLFVWDGVTNAWAKGVAWSGLSKVTDKPTGAEVTKLYADNQVYLSLISAEEFEASIEAYQYPPEFAACDGIKVVDGVRMGQQDRAAFCLAYRTIKGNDTARNAHGSIIHILYGLVAQPSEKEHETVNDSPTAASLSWDCKSTPVPAKDSKPTSVIELDSDLVKKKAFDAVTKALWGSAEGESKLLLPDEVFALVKANQA